MNTAQRVAKASAITVTVGIGAAATALAIASGLDLTTFLDDRRVILGIFVMMGVLLMAVGLERAAVLSEIERDVHKLDSAFRMGLGGQYVKGRQAIYEHTAATIATMEEGIVSVIMGVNHERPKPG